MTVLRDRKARAVVFQKIIAATVAVDTYQVVQANGLCMQPHNKRKVVMRYLEERVG